MNEVYPWGHSRRINAYPEYFRNLFGHRVQKLSIDAGFTCPNRDGSKGTGGCTFCVNDAFNPSYCQPHKSVTQQLLEGIEFHQVRYKKAGSYLAYFQAFSNTYASATVLESMYREALAVPGVIGLVIGTRPDCINTEILSLLSEIAKTHYVVVEFGVESVYDDTLQRVNRGHNFAVSQEAIRLTASYGLKVGAHFILGLPGDDRQRIIDSVSHINTLCINTIKFHQLQIFKDTVMEKDYLADPTLVPLMAMDEYIDLAVDVVERLNPAFVIERVAGEVPPRFLAAGGWGLIRYSEVFRLFEKRLEERNTWQGRLYNA
jgi:radical SAM protein (TIGR01212 family)